MAVELCSPLGSIIKVPDSSVKKYEAQGWGRTKRGPGGKPPADAPKK